MNLTALWVVLALAVLIGGLFMTGVIQTQQPTLPGATVSQGDCPDASGILTVNVVDALAQGSAIGTPTITAGINGGPVVTTVTSGTTTFPVGANVDVFVGKDDYLDEKFSLVMTCGGATLQAPLFSSTSDNPSIRAKNDDGDFMTDSHVGATNQTDLSAGESFQLVFEISGTNLESSGDGVFVVEFPASTTSNISSVTMSGTSPGTLPSVHTTQNAGSYIAVYDVPAVEGASKSTHTLEVSLTSGQDLSGACYTDWYSKQYFIDDDGSIQYGIQDSDGTAQYENTVDYDFYIN